MFHRNITGQTTGGAKTIRGLSRRVFRAMIMPLFTDMLANLLQLLGRTPDSDYEQAFVKEIAVREKLPRNPRTERTIRLCWVLIGLKSALIWWACTHYPVPVHPLWIVAPTLVFALLCTAIYYSRRI